HSLRSVGSFASSAGRGRRAFARRVRLSGADETFRPVGLVVPTASAVLLFPIISISILIPVVVVLESAALSCPVTDEVVLAIIARHNPIGSHVRRPCPITFMPLPMVPHRIPIPVYPYKLQCGSGENNVNHTWQQRRQPYVN